MKNGNLVLVEEVISKLMDQVYRNETDIDGEIRILEYCLSFVELHHSNLADSRSSIDDWANFTFHGLNFAIGRCYTSLAEEMDIN